MGKVKAGQVEKTKRGGRRLGDAKEVVIGAVRTGGEEGWEGGKGADGLRVWAWIAERSPKHKRGGGGGGGNPPWYSDRSADSGLIRAPDWGTGFSLKL
jgi:hypothetical protein